MTGGGRVSTRVTQASPKAAEPAVPAAPATAAVRFGPVGVVTWVSLRPWLDQRYTTGYPRPVSIQATTQVFPFLAMVMSRAPVVTKSVMSSGALPSVGDDVVRKAMCGGEVCPSGITVSSQAMPYSSRCQLRAGYPDMPTRSLMFQGNGLSSRDAKKTSAFPAVWSTHNAA
jgi:hypothetical protein